MAERVKPYFCGGFSACFASLVVHPIDLIKVRLQILPPGSGIVSVGQKILAEEGAKGLYAGLSASLTRQATYGTARIGLHTAFTKELVDRNGGGKPPLWMSFISSFCSGAIASSIGNPFDVSLVRMQADTTKPKAEQKGYTGVGNAITRIIKEEGFSTLYRGYPPTLLRAICMNVGQMMTYDQSKSKLSDMGLEGLTLNLASAASNPPSPPALPPSSRAAATDDALRRRGVRVRVAVAAAGHGQDAAPEHAAGPEDRPQPLRWRRRLLRQDRTRGGEITRRAHLLAANCAVYVLSMLRVRCG